MKKMIRWFKAIANAGQLMDLQQELWYHIDDQSDLIENLRIQNDELQKALDYLTAREMTH